MTRDALQKFIDALITLRDNVSDEQAVAVPALYPSWKEGVEYTAGQRLTYNEILYKVLQNHTSQADWTPDVSTSLFAKVLIVNPDVVVDWEQPDSTNPYMKGDKVIHNGKTWMSDVDNNVWEPGVYGWSEVVA